MADIAPKNDVINAFSTVFDNRLAMSCLRTGREVQRRIAVIDSTIADVAKTYRVSEDFVRETCANKIKDELSIAEQEDKEYLQKMKETDEKTDPLVCCVKNMRREIYSLIVSIEASAMGMSEPINLVDKLMALFRKSHKFNQVTEILDEVITVINSNENVNEIKVLKEANTALKKYI